MEEDIDIEEHDVMDNPMVKSVFPDLSIVKSEILDFGIEESTPLQDTLKMAKPVIADSTSDKITSSTPAIPKVERSPEVSSTQSEDVKPNINVTGAANPKTPFIHTDSDVIHNKIILGKKRTPLEELKRSMEITRKYREMDKCLSVKLVLKDWGIYLWKSKTYCSECKTLFPTLNDFDVHRANVHETVVKQEYPDVETVATISGVKKFECDICGVTVARKHFLKKHYKKQHNVVMPPDKIIANNLPLSSLNQAVVHDSVSKYIASSLNQTVVQDSVKKYMAAQAKLRPKQLAKPNLLDTNDEKLTCSHCNDTFNNKEALISHLYDVLSPKETVVQSKLSISENGQTSKRNSDANDYSDECDTSELNKRMRRVSGAPCESDGTFLICTLCSCYFKVNNSYSCHVKKFHKKFQDVIPESGPFNMKCRFCDLNFYTTIAYNRHILNMHKNDYKMMVPKLTDTDAKTYVKNSDVQLKNLAVPVPTNILPQAIPKSILYCCKKCKMHFVTHVAANGHMSQCSKQNIGYTCQICNRVISKSNRDVHNRQHLLGDDFRVVTVGNESITQKILNNCPKCGVHFNNYMFQKHFYQCGRTPPDSSYCKLCDILIDKNNAKIHDNAHTELEIKDFIIIDYEIFTEDGVIQSETKTIKRKHSTNEDFENQAVKKGKYHDSNGDDDDDSHMADTDAFNHYNDNDDESDYKEGSNSNDSAQSDDLDHESLTDNDSESTETGHPDLKLRYCFTCKCCLHFNSKLQIKHHRQKLCSDSKTQRYNCHQCCLKMSMNNIQQHRDVHKSGKSFFDFKFYDLYRNKRIKPPLPIFSNCSKCNIYYRSKEHKVCREGISQKRCARCDITFTRSAYHFHKMYHKYFELFDASRKKKAEEKYPVADEYILHQCRKCHVMVTSNNVESHKNVKYDCDTVKDLYKKCPDCEYSIVGKDYKEHVKRHDLDPEFNKTNIKILYFGDTATGTEEVDTVSDVKEPELSDSENDYEYRFSDDGGDGKYTYYQCRSCQCCLSTQSHRETHGCPMKTCRAICELCGFQFYSAILTKHYLTHKQNPDLTRDNIKIIRFGNCNVAVKSRKIRKDKKKRQETVKKQKPYYEKLKQPEADVQKSEIFSANVLYQCLKCKLNYYENVFDTHVCIKKIPYRCIICKLTFDKAVYEKHLLFHGANPNYNRSCIKVDYFSRNSQLLESDKTISSGPEISNSIVVSQNPEEEVENIYKCPCGLHYFCKTTAIIHLKTCGKVKVSKQNCTKCKLLFTPEVLFNHLVTHHGSKNKQFKYNIIDLKDDKKDVLFKCVICDLLYLDKVNIKKHVKLCLHIREPRMICQYCGLQFASNMISKHYTRHHNNTKVRFEAKDFDIITIRNETAADEEDATSCIVTNETQKKINEKEALQQLKKDGEIVGLVRKNTEEFNHKIDPHIYDNTLYKCVKCDLYFMSVRSFKEHVIGRNHKQTGRKEVCNLCGFTFPSQVYLRHMNVQHKTLEIEPGAFIIKESFENKVVRKAAAEEKKKDINVLFKCRECQIYFMLEEFIYSHVKSFHLVLKTTKLCKICGLTFSTSSYARHNYLHHEKLNLKLEDLEIREYPFIDENGEEIALIDPKATNSQYNKETLRDIHLNRYTNKLYRCVQCDLNFMTKCALESHTYVQKHFFSTPIESCSECELKFFASSLKKHKEVHHEKMALKLHDLVTITDLPPMEKNTSRKVLDEDIEPKLYKCKACNVHYVTQDRCYRHVAYGHQPIPEGHMYTCEVCSLKFMRPSLRKHETMHHVKKRYTLKQIVIEEYTPLSKDDRINCIGPKIDVYIAADGLGKNNEVTTVDNNEDDDFKDALDIDTKDVPKKNEELIKDIVDNDLFLAHNNTFAKSINASVTDRTKATDSFTDNEITPSNVIKSSNVEGVSTTLETAANSNKPEQPTNPEMNNET